MVVRRTIEEWREELVGKKFGRLLVNNVESYINPKTGKRKGFQVICLCDCGKEKIIPINSLIKGLTTSCGCYRKEVEKSLGEGLTQWRIDNPEKAKELMDRNIQFPMRWQKEHPEEFKRIYENNIKAVSLWRENNKTEVRDHLVQHISKEEQELYNYLQSLNYHIERQFLLEGHYFDFRINNFLIEYNGSISHHTYYCNLDNPNSKEPFSCSRLSSTYHRNLQVLANKNNFNLIQIWDYDWINRKEFIQKLIIGQLSSTANYKDYLEEGLLNNDYGFCIEGEHINSKGIWVSTTPNKQVVDESYTKGRVLVYNSGYTKI